MYFGCTPRILPWSAGSKVWRATPLDRDVRSCAAQINHLYLKHNPINCHIRFRINGINFEILYIVWFPQI